MSTYTFTALNTAFAAASEVYKKIVLEWNLRQLGIQLRTNVKNPQNMARFSADGEPRPYRIDDDFNGGTFTDRTLTAYNAKYDQQLDWTEFYNTYLAELPEMPFEQYAMQQGGMQFRDALMRSTLWLGVRNGAGTGAVDICDGFGTIIAAEIIGGGITPVAGAAITDSNAVEQVELVANATDVTMKERGFNVYCSYGTLEKYRKDYRTRYGFSFNKNEQGSYALDGVKANLVPVSFMGTSQRLVATYANNFVVGTDLEALSNYPTPYLNYLKNRIMMTLGCQIRDISAEALKVNDQA